MTEWQPIETAPKDGTLVLLYGPCGWDTNVDEYDDKMVRVGSYEEFFDKYVWLSDTANPYQDRILATHWMPLPNPPKEQGTEE
jgi:hypothetical protein